MTSSPAAQTRFTDQTALTPAQREKERALYHALWLDAVAFVLILVAGLSSGSLTIIAELPRGGLLFLIEIITVATLYRSHRGKFSEFEYGIGKIERVIAIVIVAGLFLAAAFTLDATLHRLSHPASLPTPAMILSVTAASYNLAVNLFCFGEFTRANRNESSLIIAAQVRSRLVKIIASAIVVLILVIATWLPDPKAATLIDCLGAIFVVGYMVVSGWQLLRESLPDLLDRALPEPEQLQLLRVITSHFEDFENFGSIKSRRSGGRAFIDINIDFQPSAPMSEVTGLCTAIEKEIVELIPDAIVSVVPRVVEPDSDQKP